MSSLTSSSDPMKRQINGSLQQSSPITTVCVLFVGSVFLRFSLPVFYFTDVFYFTARARLELTCPPQTWGSSARWRSSGSAPRRGRWRSSRRGVGDESTRCGDDVETGDTETGGDRGSSNTQQVLFVQLFRIVSLCPCVSRMMFGWE